MPLGVDQGPRCGRMVAARLGAGSPARSAATRHGRKSAGCRKPPDMGPPVPDEHVYRVVDAIDEVAKETGKTVSQIALNWLLQRPTVATLIIGARNETQLRENLGAVGWSLSKDQVARLDEAQQGDLALSLLAPARDLRRP